jgi:SAM-dependent methyltransferase
MQIEYSEAPVPAKMVLNVGSGKEHESDRPLFRNAGWETLRLDINPDVQPDLVGSIMDLDDLCAAGSFDAIFSSHSIEHLFAHEVLPALRSFHRALKSDGFALITCPDLETVIAEILKHGLDAELYASPAGPIAGLDILYGHTQSIARGNIYMAHNTGFTAARLSNVLFQAGFASCVINRSGWDLWAVGMREHADQDAIRRELCAGGLLLSF